MAKKTKKEMALMGQEIMKAAKLYRKQHPGAKWISCVKAGAAAAKKARKI
jgi:hypothetical protein